MKPWVLAAMITVGATPQAEKKEPSAQQKETETGYRFSTDVPLIPVPVFVTDGKGQPVTGLTAEDFVVKEEGKPRPLEIFDAVVYEDKRTETATTGARPTRPAVRRQFLLLFDLAFAKPRGLIRAKSAAIRFVKDELAPSDLVAVATYSSLGGLKVLVNFSTDRAHTLQAVDSIGLQQATQLVQDPVGFAFDILLDQPPPVQGFAPRETDEKGVENELRAISDKIRQSDEEAYRNHAAQFVTQFDRLASGLGALSGRKFILLLSEGINSRFLTGTGIAEADADVQKFVEGRVEDLGKERYGRAELRDVLMEGLRRAAGMDVVVHALDTSGLGGEFADASESFRDSASGPTPGRGEGGGQDSLYLMANETGGKLYKNLNDLGPALASILSETRAYYLLGFIPEKLENKGRFRKIQVEVKRAGLEVSARRGYFEPKAAAKLTDVEKRLSIAEYVSKDIVSEDVRFDALVATYPGKDSIARVPVFLKVPGDQFLKAKRTSDVLQVELYGYVTDSEGRFMDFFNKTLAFDLKKERKRFETAGFKYYDLLVARPGATRVKLLVKDVETARTGSVIQDIDVPNFGKDDLVVTTPVFMMAEPDWIVTRGFDPGNPEPRRKDHPTAYPFTVDGKDFIPAVHPALKAGEPTSILVRVYHLKPHPTTGQPQTEMKFERIGEAGDATTIKSVGLARPPIQPEPACFELLLQAQWSGVPPGAAFFQMSMTDTLAKKTGRARSAFTLVP